MTLQTGTIEETCRQRGDISAYIDGELTSAEELALEMHIASCKECHVELNLQKQILAALDFSLEGEPEIEIPKNFAKVVAVRAESGVCGLRSKEERFRALFLCALMFLIVLLGLGGETGSVFATFGKFLEKTAALIGFIGHLVYDFALGTVIILRSLSGTLVFNSFSLIIIAASFIASAVLLSRLISRFNRQ